MCWFPKINDETYHSDLIFKTRIKDLTNSVLITMNYEVMKMFLTHLTPPIQQVALCTVQTQRSFG